MAAATELTVQSMTSAGVEVTFGNANADGNYFTNDGRTFIWIKNGDEDDHNIIIDSPTNCNYGFAHDVTVEVTAEYVTFTRPFESLNLAVSKTPISLSSPAVTVTVTS